MAKAPTEPKSEGASEWTIGRVLTWATDDFRKRDFDSPRLDAELLLGHALSVDRMRLFMDASRVLEAGELTRFRDLISRRRRREPVAYILGQREFHGLTFRVDARVLVPRPDTETLVRVALDRTRGQDLSGDALDLCTGSGCVALAFARARPTWRVTGVDISPGAVEVARENADRLGAVWNTSFMLSDLDHGLPEGAAYDLVTSNPPYIPTGELAELPPDVRDHEPRLALDGGKDGLDLVRRVVAVARARLRPMGVVAIEIGHDQADRAAALLAEHGFADVKKHRDYGGIERVVSGRSG